MSFPWVVYYGVEDVDIKKFEPYNPIILERDNHPPLQSLLDQKKEVLGYVNIAEIEDERRHFQLAKEQKLLINENPDWPGSWAVDVRRPEWKNLIIHEIIPEIIKAGFTGLFLDQMDVGIALEQENPEKFKGMNEALVDLLKTIRITYPELRMMLNRGYELLPEVGHLIDYELAETLYTVIDFQKEKYLIRPKSEFEWQLSVLNEARKSFPHLVIFALDYWDPEDKKTYKKIYSTVRSHCIRPYVTTYFLDQISPEPK